MRAVLMPKHIIVAWSVAQISLWNNDLRNEKRLQGSKASINWEYMLTRETNLKLIF